MEEIITLGKVFDMAADSDDIWKLEVQRVTPDYAGNAMTIDALAQGLIDEKQRALACKAICDAYGLADIKLHITYALTGIDEAFCELIKGDIAAKYPTLGSAVNASKWEINGNIIKFETPEDMNFLRFEALSGEISAFISEKYGVPVAIKVEAVTKDGGDDYEKQRLEHMTRVQAECDAAAREQPYKKPAPTAGKGTFIRRAAVAKVKPVCADEDIIFGRAGAYPAFDLGNVMVDSGKITVHGEIFSLDVRKINGRDMTVISFEMTDGTGSAKVSKVFSDAEANDIKKKLVLDMSVVVQGLANYSKYDQDTVITPYAILRTEKKLRSDPEAGEKRVELHFHTIMSSMDGLCNPTKGVKLAAHMGHRALAITDHGVVQAFPEAAMAAKGIQKSGKDFKILYGVEAYCVNDMNKNSVVKGYSNIALEDEIVVFDLETTGLSPINCQIIEIAAAIVRNGEIISNFHSYVKPTTAVPIEITKLTGITNEMVSTSSDIGDILPKFLDFCGTRPMCAHNANFDISFLKAACGALAIEHDFCSIDTLELSCALMPELKKHKLNSLADAMGLTFNHHRAEDDTAVLVQIFLNLCKMLKEKTEITRVSQINNAVLGLLSGTDTTKGKRSHHLIVLAKNREGLMALYKMVSLAHLEHYNKRPIIPMSMLSANRKELILGSACEAGELFSAVASGKPWNELCSIAEFYDFLEIQPIGNNRFMVIKGTAKDDDQLRDFNKTIVKLGGVLGKPVCATGDVHFLEPTDAIYREILMTGMGFSDASNQAPLYFKTTAEMLEEFSYLGEEKAHEVVVTNTNMIADMCEVFQPVLDGTYPPSIENSARDIEEMARKRANELYAENGVLNPVVARRLEDELVPIIKHGFDVMYIIAQKLVKKSMDDGYLVGSRGSVGSSFVAYLTGITEVNSLAPHYRCPACKHAIFDDSGSFKTGVDMPDRECPICGEKMIKDGFDIPFATFLGFDGDKAPDIDLNFSGEYQLNAHKYTVELFGKDNVFKAGTIGTVKDKTAYGFVKKYLDEKGIVKTNAEVNRLVAGCTGVKRTTGQHPGGLIVLPKGRSIYEFTPVQHPADDVNSDIITTHFDYHSIHDNLLKLDLLGHDDPTMIRRLQDLSGMDPRTIPLDDKETMKIFTDISPLGINSDDILEETGAAAIPEFGTKFVRGMLMETQPTTFDGLLRISGLSHGTNVWRNNAQDIISSGKAKLKDIICVRDDITMYLLSVGLEPKKAFTISESVRKGKGLKPDWEEEMRAHSVPDWYIGSCKKIEYMFPRAHAVAYVMMAYRIAWFKVHRPLDFYSAYFSIRANAFDASVMAQGDEEVCKKYRNLKALPKRTAVEEDTMVTLEVCHEFYKRGFSFAPIDVYTCDVKGFRIEGNTLVPPLTSLPGVGEAAAEGIVQSRKNGAFMSIEDMIIRSDKVSKGVAETLEKVGALKGIPKTNQLDLFEAMGL